MYVAWLRKTTTSILALLLILPTGCSGGWQALERKDLAEPEPAKSYLVTKKDGDQLTFISLHLEGDWLVGTQRVTVVREVGEGETGRQNIANRYEEVRLPWAEVERVEADVGRKGDHSLILAAGAIGVGVAAFLLLTSDSVETSDDNGGGKTPP